MAGIDASTAATIAALVVAILAMLVAVSQVVQQYFLTGQLIRLCDAVVYGKMPGRGRRVWQLNQLRFRVVYSIPQVSLRKELWPSKLPHIPSFAKGSRALPDLGLTEIGDSNENFDFDNLSNPEALGQSPVCFTAGEASWVSFCRAVQPSSGRSIILDLIQADADRCPPDLPNVPIQMSMRDIAVMGLMAGMKCTQASFDSRSLSMQGLIGTITTSQHPLLGPLLHFNPRNLSSKEMRDLQIGHGAIDSSWMATLWDEVTIAGHRYTRHERMQIERDEAIWANRPRERAIVAASRNRSPPPASLYSLRRRSSVASTTAISSQATGRGVIPRTDTEAAAAASHCQECQPLWTRSDGDWYLDNGSSHTNQVQSTKLRPLDGKAKVKDGILKETSKVRQAIWVRVWTVIWQSRKRRRPNTPSDPFGLEVELGNFTAGPDPHSRVHPVRVESSRHNIRRMHLHSHPAGLDQGAELPPRWFIKDYIDQKRAVMQDRELTDVEPRDGPLLLGWYDDEGQEIAELNKTKENLAKMILEIWATTNDDASHQRAAFYAHKWRDVVRQRQLDRESRNKNRPASTKGSFKNRSQYGQSNRYRSSDSTRSRRTFHSEYRSSRAPSRTSFYSGPAGEEIDLDLRRYGESASQAPTPARGANSRASSHVRSRPPVKRDVEYGNTIVAVTPEAQAGETHKSPDSDGRSQSHARVGFDHEIHFIDSSGSERDADETEKLSLAGKASMSTDKESSKDRPEATVDPPPKGILKPSKINFPEESNPVREGVAPLKNTELNGIPPGARWTKIDRRLVSPAALEAGKERFEERNDHVIVLRVLPKEEIQEYALMTIQLRGWFMARNICALLLISGK